MGTADKLPSSKHLLPGSRYIVSMRGQSLFGTGATNSRFTLSSGHGRAASGLVVLLGDVNITCQAVDNLSTPHNALYFHGFHPLPGRALQSNVPRGGVLPCSARYLSPCGAEHAKPCGLHSVDCWRHGFVRHPFYHPHLSWHDPRPCQDRIQRRPARNTLPLSECHAFACRPMDGAIGKALQIGPTPKTARCSSHLGHVNMPCQAMNEPGHRLNGRSSSVPLPGR